MIALGGVPGWDTALTSAGGRLFWILIIFGVVLLVGSAGRGRPTRAVIRAAAPRRDRAGRPAYGEIDLYRCSGYPRSDGVDACAQRLGG